MTGFVGRRAFLADVTRWLASDQRYFVLGGGVGSGKSTALRRVVALHNASVAHFCDPTDLSTRSPSTAARNLAEQLTAKVPGFVSAFTDGQITGAATAGVADNAIVAGVFVNNFTVNASDENTWLQAVRRPLESLVTSGGLPAEFFIVVDALDEADRYDGTKLSELIAGFGALDQVRWLLSTRYPASLVKQLSGSVWQWNLSANQGGRESDDDVRLFLSHNLPRLSASDQAAAADRSHGNFLYARLLVDMLAEPTTPLGGINLPDGLDDALHGYLRQIAGGDRQVSWLNGYEPVLAVLTVIREPVSEAELARLSGVRNPVLSHVLRRLTPLLAAGGAMTEHIALYHAAFYEFLVDEQRSGDWWCDPASSQSRLCDAFATQTRQWTEWHRLDRYGVVHLLEHAALAGWSAREFDRLIVPGYLAEVARQPGPVAAVARHIEPAIRAATAERDLGRAFSWQWLPHLLRNSLHEMLAAETPTLLIKAGQVDLAVEALSSISQTDDNLPYRRGQVVETLAAEGQLDMARATIGMAQQQQRPALLVRAAIGVAADDPALAWSLCQEAVSDPADRPPGDSDRLAVLLAAAPDFVDQAWQLAGDDQARQAVLVAVAEHQARQAAIMASREGLDEALSAAWLAAAKSDPALALELMAPYPDWLNQRLPAEFVVAQATGTARQPSGTARDLVLLAGALVADANKDDNDRAEILAQAQHCAAALDVGMSRFLADHVALSRLDYTPLRGRQPAAAIAAIALTAMIDLCATLPRRSVPAQVLGGLCGSLRVLDTVAGDAAIVAATDLAGLDQVEFSIEVITRLCPVEPAAAWAVAQRSGQHRAYRAWVAALPPTLVSVCIQRVAGIDPQYSGTRAELAGLLATKLAAGDRATARTILELITPTVGSVMFDTELAIVAAACGDIRGDVPSTAWELVDYAADLRDGDVLGLLRYRHRSTDAALSGADLAAIADELAAHTRDLAIPVLARAAGALVSRGDRAGALALLLESLHPGYAPISVHVPRWPGIERAVLLAHRALGSLADLVPELLHQPQIGDRDGDVVEALALLAVHLDDDERQSLLTMTASAGPIIADVLALVDRICRGEPDAAHDIAAILPRAGLARASVLAVLVPYTLLRTADAVAALALTPTGRRGLFEPLPALDGLEHEFLIEVLPAIARTEPAAAQRLAMRLCEDASQSSTGRDALHAVAVAVAERNWADGIRVAETIDTPGVRGMALADLAAVAVRLPDKASRRAAYLAVLDVPDTTADWSNRGYRRRGLLAALPFDPEPQPDVLVRLIPDVFRTPATEPLALEHLAELAALVARAGAADAILAGIPDLADLAASAWPSWQSRD